MSGEGLVIADVGTGSGCIAITLAKELPVAEIYALDVSPTALAVAKRNAKRLGFSDRIRFLESNLLDAFSTARTQHAAPLQQKRSMPDVHNSSARSYKSRSSTSLSAIRPTLAVTKQKLLHAKCATTNPRLLLFGGDEGYELYADLITQSAAHLTPGGILVLELGHDSLPAVQPLLDSPTWTNIGFSNDLAGIPASFPPNARSKTTKHHELLSPIVRSSAGRRLGHAGVGTISGEA